MNTSFIPECGPKQPFGDHLDLVFYVNSNAVGLKQVDWMRTKHGLGADFLVPAKCYSVFQISGFTKRGKMDGWM